MWRNAAALTLTIRILHMHAGPPKTPIVSTAVMSWLGTPTENPGAKELCTPKMNAEVTENVVNMRG